MEKKYGWNSIILKIEPLLLSAEKETRIMLVVDCEKTLVADRGPHREEFLGVFTDNILLASFI